MNNRKIKLAAGIGLALFVSISAAAQSGGDFTITQSVIANGGQQTAGGAFSLDSTIGQADAGSALSGSPFVVTSGFWNYNALAPNFAGASISGRVRTESGKGIRNVSLTLTDATTGETLHTRSGSFGSYRFENVPIGQSYILSAGSKRFSFALNDRFITPLEELTDVDFIGAEEF
jgi:hypothetical protein